ncbi:MAG: SGNH/GDSL hydrolase family protein [bacterium]
MTPNGGTAGTSRLQRLLARAGLSLLAVMLTLTLAEAVIRIFNLAPPLNRVWLFAADPLLPFKTKPNASGLLTAASGEFEYEFSYNSFGFRDIDHEYAKPPGVFRILGLGDSFTQGCGAPLQETFLYRLEAQLNSRTEVGAPVEIIKAGIGRYFPEPERMLLEHYGLRYEPDLIVVAFVPNDVIDTYRGIDAVALEESGYLCTREAKRLGKVGVYLYLHSHLGRIFITRYVQQHIAAECQPRPAQIFRQDGYHEQDWLTVEAEYEKMVQLARGAGAEILFCAIPRRPPWQDYHRYPGRRLARWAARNNVEFVDLFPAMQAAASGEQLYYSQDFHCTPAGYRVIADTLFSVLIARQLVP